MNRDSPVSTSTLTNAPTIEIDNVYDDDDDSLSKSNGQRYTYASSSSQFIFHDPLPDARQSMLNTILVHLTAHEPLSNLSKWEIYRNLNEKIAASMSPSIYRKYERIAL